MIGQCGVSCSKGTATSLAGNAVATTRRLMALLRMTASRAKNPKSPMSRGSRNSAPPRPIMPPSNPTAAPAPAAAHLLRRSGRDVRVECVGCSILIALDHGGRSTHTG